MAVAAHMSATVHPEPSADAPPGPRLRFASVAWRLRPADKADGLAKLAPTTLAGAAKLAMLHNKSLLSTPPPPTIVDCNSNFGTVAKKLILGRASVKKRFRRHAAPLPSTWRGASKLVRDVGDTVISVAISEDDT